MQAPNRASGLQKTWHYVETEENLEANPSFPVVFG
jgi:hypothetical protein